MPSSIRMWTKLSIELIGVEVVHLAFCDVPTRPQVILFLIGDTTLIVVICSSWR